MKTLITILWLLTTTQAVAQVSQLQDGDIIFHTSRSAQSLAVQRATGSKYSHMGLIWFKNNKPYVFEAISTVGFTPLQEWIDRGKNNEFAVKRLRNADSMLTSATKLSMIDTAGKYTGKPYDLTFEWSDSHLYCSELVWKVYNGALGIKLAKLQRLREFNLSDKAVKEKIAERYGTRIPFDEPVVSPQAIFDSPEFTTVLEKKN